MSPYTAFNAALSIVVFSTSYFLLAPQRRCHALLAGRIGVLITLLSYPWDFFAVQLGVWRYPVDPGLTVYGVPVNDLTFIFLCTFFTSSVLLRIHRREASRERHAKSEHAR